MAELKALEILNEIKNTFDENIVIGFTQKSINIDEAIKELEQYEQNFKDKEFKYRTQCQNVLSAARVEADAMPDRLAELEKVILDFYLAKGYQIGVGGWGFNVEIESDYKSKSLLVYFREHKHDHYSQVFNAEAEATKEMFDKAIEYFRSEK